MYLIIVAAINMFVLCWIVRAFKSALFWIYLWQLKEYHVGRFIDHFRTFKGKKIFLNLFTLSKYILFLVVLAPGNYFLSAALLLLLIYIAEFFIFLKNIFSRSLKIPAFTAKTIMLTSVSFAIIVWYFFFAANYLTAAHWRAFLGYLLIFDILSPVIVSIVVLAFQPLFVVMRNRILEKAKRKITAFSDLLVIGITGSYGKTSTKEFLATILSLRYRVLSTPEHKNSEMGIATTILQDLNDNHEVFVVEMGAYNKGGISLLCDMVKPTIGMVTGVNEQHLSTFGSLDNLLSAEGGRELEKKLPDKGFLVVNGDNKYCLELYKQSNHHKKIYTLKKDKIDSDIWTEDIEVKKEYVSFIARTKDNHMAHVNVGVLGAQNVQNLLGAILVAKELGMTLEEISRACEDIAAERAGMVIKKGVHGIELIDSSYSSNPDGVMADLNYLNIFPGKKVVIMPCLIELGKKSMEVHYQIGKKIAAVCDMAIIMHF